MKAYIVPVVVIFAMIFLQDTYAIDAVKSNPVNPAVAAKAGAQHESPEVRKVELQIDADRDWIIAESDAVNADRRKLKDADKVSDKVAAEQLKKDITEREARIKDLKKGIRDKKEQRYFMMNGKQKDESRRTRLDAK